MSRRVHAEVGRTSDRHEDVEKEALDEEQIPCLGSEAAPDGCVLWVWQYDLRGAAEAVQRMMR